jgi:Family of unknown function (DUF6282)
LPEVRKVLKIATEKKLVVQTGHISPTEALAVIAAGGDMGVDRIVVTHAQFEVVNMSLEQMKQAASMALNSNTRPRWAISMRWSC